ncbi:MAG TPA: hypothetical protein VEY12_06370 [Thermoplasmata archaeon]|nr:hypothetical protein [Thermoplasmata archaeon]
MRRIVTHFGEAEFKELVAFCKKHKISLYGLAKKAIREYVDRHA